MAAESSEETALAPRGTKTPGLKKIPPYWYPYTTMAKERWLGREILEVVSTEFRDRSMEYYVSELFFKLGSQDLIMTDCYCPQRSEVCTGIWSDNYQWQGSEA